LGAEISVLFNSSDLCTDMRKAMGRAAYGSLTFWIGCILILSACVTILGLVTTFTVWGMISAISDTNAHCLLRSSMGQYACSLPSRFVVGALYLFLLWVILFMGEILNNGPFHFILLGLVLFLFFQVVVSLSAFGRLIIHTGAMGQRPVLDPEMERLLLPSGLHAALLIKATERKRRDTNDVTSLHRKAMESRASSSAVGSSAAEVSPSPRLSLLDDSVSSLHHSVGDIQFPRPSILNSTMNSNELLNMVEQALSPQTTSDEPSKKSKYDTFLDDALHGSIASMPELNGGPSPDSPTFVSEEKEAQRMARRRSSGRLVQEWKEEKDVRNMYQVPPPAALYDDTERNDDDSLGLEVLTQPGLLRHFSREIRYRTDDSGKRTARGELETLLHGNAAGQH